TKAMNRLHLESLDERIAPAAGYLDPTFGNAGTVIAPIGVSSDIAYAMTIDRADRIVIAGTTFASTYDFALARFNPDGTPDATFGAAPGKLSIDFAGDSDGANAVAMDASGRIVAAGYAYVGGNESLALARFLPNGVLDPTFGTGGKVTTTIVAGDINSIRA